MSIFDNKINKSVAEAVMKVMQQEELKGNQHKIDANKNGKVDAHDFKLLRAKKDMKKEEVDKDEERVAKTKSQTQKTFPNVKHFTKAGHPDWEKHGIKDIPTQKEEVEQLDEVGDTPAGRKALGSYVMKALHDKDRQKGVRKATSRLYKDNYYGKKTNEEVEEQIDEAFPSVEDAKKRMAAGKTATGTVTKTKTGLIHKRDFEHNAEDDDHPEKVGRPKGYGARQNYKRSTRVNEELSFTEMLELYNEHGIKVLAPIEKEEMNIDGTTIEVIDADKVNGFVETTIEEGLGDAVKGAVGVVKNVINKEKAYQAEKQKKAGEVLSKMRREEVTNDQFTKEFEDQKASFEGKKPQPKVAAGKTTGVKIMPEEVEQLDELSNDKMKAYIKKAAETDKDLKRGDGVYRAMKKIAGVHGHVAGTNKKQNEEVELDERTLTSGESKKKEEYVKGMKKGLSGFKQRYGERAKEVMYATATKMAKKD